MTHTTTKSQNLNIEKVKSYEDALNDVTEIIVVDYLKRKCIEVEKDFKENQNELKKTRLGIIYHEVALNLSFLSKTTYKGYAKKSFDLLSELSVEINTTPELLPVISAYRASALSLVCAETKKLKLLDEAFKLFSEAINKYSAISASPEFLRGSVAENLPWFFFSKRKIAKHDFQSIIDKQHIHNSYADTKTMSFTYWAWAKQHQAKKYRQQSLAYLRLAIELDPDYKAGRNKSEELMTKLQSD